MQPVALRSAAGRTLHADQLLPRSLCAPPTIFVWLHGLASVRRSQKSDALLGMAQKWGAGYLRLDMTGHGESGGCLDEVTVSSWIDDAQCALQHIISWSPRSDVEPPRVRLTAATAHSLSRYVSLFVFVLKITSGQQVVLVGYSLGGLVGAHLAAQRDLPLQPSGLVLLAPGIGLARRLQHAKVDLGTGLIQLPSAYAAEGTLVVAQKLLDDLHQNHDTDATIARALRLPTFIAHGEFDEVVAIEDVVAFHDLLSPDMSRLLRISEDDGGDHRLNRCIGKILFEVESFLQQHNVLVSKERHPDEGVE